MKKVSSREQSRVKKAETAAGNSELTESVELDFEKKLILFIDCFLLAFNPLVRVLNNTKRSLMIFFSASLFASGFTRFGAPCSANLSPKLCFCFLSNSLWVKTMHDIEPNSQIQRRAAIIYSFVFDPFVASRKEFCAIGREMVSRWPPAR